MNALSWMADALTKTPSADAHDGDEYRVAAFYRPTGAPAAMLRALRARGRMTSAELAEAGGVRVSTVGTLMRAAVNHRLARFDVRGHRKDWEWIG